MNLSTIILQKNALGIITNIRENPEAHEKRLEYALSIHPDDINMGYH